MVSRLAISLHDEENGHLLTWVNPFEMCSCYFLLLLKLDINLSKVVRLFPKGFIWLGLREILTWENYKQEH